MPPAVFIGAARSSPGAALWDRVWTAPVGTKPGDVMIALTAGFEVDAFTGPLDPDNSPTPGWRQLGISSFINSTFTVFMAAARVAQADDSGTIEMYTAGSGAWKESLLVVYRNLDPSIAVVGAVSGNLNVGTQNFQSSSINLVRYSDLYIGFTACVTADVAITTPAGANKRLEIVGHSAGRRFCAWDVLAEAPGATGVKTATTAANQDGIAGALALSASGLVGGKSLSRVSPVPGMLGLPTRGV